MAVNTDFGGINKRITGSQLLNSIFIIRQRIITHIVVSIGMISLSAHRSATSVPHSDYNEPQLSQTSIINIINRETCRHIFEERSRINIRNDRINLCRVKVGRLPHHAIQIGHSIGSFYLKAFRCFPSHLIDRLQIGLFQRHNHLSIPVTNHIHRFLRNSRIRIYHISVRRRDTDIM